MKHLTAPGPRLLRALLAGSLAWLPCATHAGLFSPKGDSPQEKRQVVLEQREEMLAELYKTKPELKDRIAKAAGCATFKQTDMNLFLLRTFATPEEAVAALTAAVQAREGDDVLEYAQRLASCAGAKDGLFWPPDLDGEISPLGPLVADADSAGYALRSRTGTATPEPFHGYYFRTLTRQGRHAPGGKYDYVIHGNMIGGFGLVGWPAESGESGVMTFMVNQQGHVYQQDLGPNTKRIVRKMSADDPAPTWRVSPD